MIVWIARVTGRSIRRVLAEDTPVEVGLWRRHFERHPVDEVPRMLSRNLSIQCADPRPEDWDLRPYAYSERERGILSRAAAEAAERREREAKDALHERNVNKLFGRG